MPKRSHSGGLSVGEILNESQRGSATTHIRYAKNLWESAEEDTQGTYDSLIFGLKLFMTVSEKTVYQDRILRFLGTFAAQANSQGRVDFVETILHELVDLSYAKDHTARWRACQLVHCLICSLPGDAAISDEVADAVQSAMLERLDDAKPNIRASAVRALARLPIPDEDGDFTECPVVEALTQLLSCEKSKDVRKAILASLPPAPTTANILVSRTRDESDDVRRITYLAIAEKLRPEALADEERAMLVKEGLGDRSPSVAEAARSMLEVWLDGACEGEPLALLRALNVEKHPEESYMAIKSLIECGRLDAVSIGKLAEEEGVGLRRKPEDGLMCSEEALFWRVICECLSNEATNKGLAAAATGGAVASIKAAAASDCLEALEAALPSSVEEVVSVIDAHVIAGPQYRFAAGQLMALASTAGDFTDATGRRSAARLLEAVMSSAVCMGLHEQNQSEETIKQIAQWREIVSGLLRKVHSSPAELADAVLSVLTNLPAAAYATDAEWLHGLSVAALLLENLPGARPALAVSSSVGSLEDVYTTLINPATAHSSTLVRREAYRCLGLYCLLDGIPTSISAHLRELRSCLVASSEDPSVRTVAAMAIGDLALQRGPKVLDSLLVAECASAEDDPSIDPVLASEPTLDLLLDVLTSWQRTYRPEEEQLGAFGAAVAEAMVRLAAVNEFRQASDERKGVSTALEDGEVVRLLVALMLVNFDPVSEPATRLRQCLAVFFERFAGLSLTSQQYLATALLPAARTAAADDMAVGGKRNTLTGAVAPRLMRFALQLLQMPVLTPEGNREALGHEPLAELLLMEAVVCAEKGAAKPYMAALCKLPLNLPMYISGPDTLETMQRIQVYAKRARDLVSDRLVARDLDAIVEKYAVPAEHQASAEPLDQEHIAALLEGVKSHVEMFCAGYPAPYDEGAASAKPAAGKKASAPKSRRPAPLKKPVDSDSSEDDESSEDEESDNEEEQVQQSESAAVVEEEDDSEEDVESDVEEEVENKMAARRMSEGKSRRKSIASVAALRQALASNRLDDDE